MAQRVDRGIALLFHDRGTRRGWVVSSTPRPHFAPGKDPVPILQEAGWAPGPVWTGGKSRPHRDSIPDRPARSQSLYRLSYRAHRANNITNKNCMNKIRILKYCKSTCLLKETDNTRLWNIAFQKDASMSPGRRFIKWLCCRMVYSRRHWEQKGRKIKCKEYETRSDCVLVKHTKKNIYWFSLAFYLSVK